MLETVDLPKCAGLYQWENFSRAVRGKRLAEEISVETVVAGVRVIEAMKRAVASGATERV